MTALPDLAHDRNTACVSQPPLPCVGMGMMDDMHTAIPLGTSKLPLSFLLSIAAPSGWLPVSDSQRSPHGRAVQNLSQPATAPPLDLPHHASLHI